jgi:hypothetical protein
MTGLFMENTHMEPLLTYATQCTTCRVNFSTSEPHAKAKLD